MYNIGTTLYDLTDFYTAWVSGCQSTIVYARKEGHECCTSMSVQSPAYLGLRQLLIMCYRADRLARCEAKKGEVRKKQAQQFFTDFKACFSTQLTDGLR
jgi:hypothetical protein